MVSAHDPGLEGRRARLDELVLRCLVLRSAAMQVAPIRDFLEPSWPRLKIAEVRLSVYRLERAGKVTHLGRPGYLAVG